MIGIEMPGCLIHGSAGSMYEEKVTDFLFILPRNGIITNNNKKNQKMFGMTNFTLWCYFKKTILYTFKILLLHPPPIIQDISWKQYFWWWLVQTMIVIPIHLPDRVPNLPSPHVSLGESLNHVIPFNPMLGDNTLDLQDLSYILFKQLS